MVIGPFSHLANTRKSRKSKLKIKLLQIKYLLSTVEHKTASSIYLVFFASLCKSTIINMNLQDYYSENKCDHNINHSFKISKDSIQLEWLFVIVEIVYDTHNSHSERQHLRVNLQSTSVSHAWYSIAFVKIIKRSREKICGINILSAVSKVDVAVVLVKSDF